MDSQYYREYYDLERGHWWFKARLNILKNTLDKKLDKTSGLKILNIGAATGATSQMLAAYGEVTSLEYDKTCCEILLEKTGIDAVCASMTGLPFSDNTFDLVCAFDVIEHIEDDKLAINEMMRVMKINGNYMVTVPAFQMLWSNHDVVNHHFRRYTKTNFNNIITGNKLTISYSTYFNFWLFFPIFWTRLVLNLLPKKKDSASSGSDNEVFSSGLINSILYRIFLSEKSLIPRIKLPVGVSILTFGHKS
jgi:2-polyprenyl-3-methyl-5-hydroxy-6-metoxy-1,4-benzoquinol methylase